MAKSLRKIEDAFWQQQEELKSKEPKKVKPKEKKKSRKIDKILMGLVFIIGMGIFIYPTVSDYVARRNVIRGASTYKHQITDLSQEKIDKMWKEAQQYNDSLNGDPVPDPFIPGSGRVLPENYTKVLNAGEGIMGYVEIPKINVYLPIYHGASDAILELGAGHIEQTTLPIGGEGNLSVITAHTGFAGAEMFNRLIELENDDTFIIRVLDKVLTYQVDDIKEILPEEIESLTPVDGKDYVTLVTCTPYGVNSHRLLVRGSRIPNAAEQVAEIEAVPFPWELVMMISVAVVLFSIVFLWNLYRDKKQRG